MRFPRRRQPFVTEISKSVSPHCNSEVLHAPGICRYCDFYPERQSARKDSGASFSSYMANGWKGNIAQP